jgi:hypothetical protein
LEESSICQQPTNTNIRMVSISKKTNSIQKKEVEKEEEKRREER